MTELLAALTILLADWGAASSHMAYTTQLVIPEGDETIYKGDLLHMERRGPKRLPFYDQRLPIFGDVWHLVAGLRYCALVALAVVVFGYQWEWYLGTAAVNSLGWYVLKVAHGKVGAWGWEPRWLKQITTAWRVSKTPPPTYDTPGEGED